MKILDFRSDTVTKPSTEMYSAMAVAEVGDDVLERDPTMERLECKVAELLGKEAALWVPTGCMSNLIGLMLHLKRGDRFLAPAQAHILGSELGTAAWLALGMPESLPWEGGPGKITPSQVIKSAGNPGQYYSLRTTLLCIENTHNFAGGTCLTASEHKALVLAAKEKSLKIHLDGARLWHTAVATGDSLSDLSWGADTVSVCLSKGLGAPMGSVIVGNKDYIAEARRIRKMLGGGVRQGGVVAAAGIIALDQIPRLSDDHARATRLADGLTSYGFKLTKPETNIMFVQVPKPGEAMTLLESVGIRCLAVGPALRFITHRDQSDGDVGDALERIKPIAEKLIS
ncbi:MAG: aminotransferase class I/II-fold pyridoxal phosphate-dependent enzyme [Holophagaceae bacterium]|nr:aminotransferase class I/II-fold pyridoxal phosphate-dependent enzyme [Holophagaceae bacterium]